MSRWLSGLGARISLLSVLHLSSMLAVIFLVSWATFDPPADSRWIEHTEFDALSIVNKLGDPEGWRRDAAALTSLGVRFSVFDENGAVVAANTEPALKPTTPDATFSEHPRHMGRDKGPIYGRTIRLPDGREGRLLFSPPPFVPPFRYLLPGFLLALVASASGALLVARSFARPLKRLTLAARRLGAGDLSARTGLVRPDEFGEVSRAFDEMATRLGVLMRAQQELLANVSHELRTPLARIRAALDFASEADGAVLARAVQDFNADVRELERLVSDVLQTARLDLEAGRIGPHLPVLRVEPFELASLVRDAAERFASRHPSRRLVVEQKDVNLTLTADPMLIRRAVDNVIDNAVWYSDASTEVTLKVEVAGDEVRLSVVDRGIGIAPEDLPRLTEPFFRTDPSRARRTGGLGLGLSLTQRIVDAHGGTLSIESELGKGTTVHITLPVGEALARVALGP